MRRSFRFLVAAAAAVLPAVAGAQRVNFSGVTRGCFYMIGAPCSPSGTFGTGNFVDLANGSGQTVLRYNFGSFSVFTDPSALVGTSSAGIGANALAGDSFGSAQLSFLRDFDFDGYGLAIETRLDGPTIAGVTPYTHTNYYALEGSTGTASDIGGVTFEPIDRTLVAPGTPFTGGDVYPLGPGGGTAAGTILRFTLSTNDVTNGYQKNFSGFVRINSAVSTVPEPATVALMATGLVGLLGAGVVRRRNAA